MGILKKNKITLLVIWLWLFNILVAYAITETNTNDVADQKKVTAKEFHDPTLPKIFLPDENNDLNAATGSGLPNATAVIVKGAEQTGNANKLNLSIILIRPNDKTAVINNQIVRERDMIAKYQVIKIDHNKVTLKKPKEAADPLGRRKQTVHKEKDDILELKLPTVAIKKYLEHQ